MEPFFLKPDMRHYLWGGQRLVTMMNKPKEADTLAESWELACHPKAEVLVADGPLAGMRFGDFVLRYPQFVGRHFFKEKEFPVLLKLLDTKICNSIQVHPDDEYALRVEDEKGKTEMWLILDTEPDAYIYAGFQHKLTKDEIRQRVSEGNLEDVLAKHAVHPGDFFFIPPGTVHAIGAGILLAEIQQNSDITYRLYDFDRIGSDGRPRDLHVESALEVASLSPPCLTAPGARILASSSNYTHTRLAATKGFIADKLVFNERYELSVSHNSFLAILCLAGDIQLRCGDWHQYVHAGACVFVPAGSDSVQLLGSGDILMVALE